MNFKKILQIFSLLLFSILPINAFAYSDHVIVGGENIGINVNQKYVSIVGFYEVSGKNIAKDAGFKVGDLILKIENTDIIDISQMIETINQFHNKEKLTFTVMRDLEEVNIEFPLITDRDGIIKTGLYVKDKITGIGTLTYIDPNSLIYGALGHEITDKTTSYKVEIKDGTIFLSEVYSITPSESGSPGSKNAKFYRNDVFGTIEKNEEEGIFGKYNADISQLETVEVGKLSEVKEGKAYLRTVIDGTTKKDYEIKILEIYPNEETKNILFEITDEELLEETNGVVAGMSGSPIIQNGKIIAACTHVVVNNPHKGFAIAIENMLEEGEK